MNYRLIKKIHLYACLTTAAVLTMFILTSYLMIHHKAFNQKPVKTNYGVHREIKSENDWTQLISDEHINGRMTKEIHKEDQWMREYSSAEQFSKLSYDGTEKMVSITRTDKSLTNALIGIHRQRGYHGTLPYFIYAFLLDLVGLSLILFTITGVILWFQLLKNDRLAWIIFAAGFLYFIATIYMLMHGR